MPTTFSVKHQHIGIIGCGWLGLPLAQQLVASGHSVTGTARKQSKLAILDQYGFDAVPLELGNLQPQSIQKLKTCNTWVLNIPPGRRTLNPEQFITQMQALITHAKDCSLEHLIFVSTTSVYGEQEGTISEDSEIQPCTPSAKAHCKIEQFLRADMSANSSILRLAGLVDNNRHPVRMLANKKAISGANQAVNLIHKQDVCNAIERLICLGPQSTTLHLSAPQHPTRKNYYQWAANQLGLVKPEFELELDKTIRGKQIDATHTLATLGLCLQYSSPYQMLSPVDHPNNE